MTNQELKWATMIALSSPPTMMRNAPQGYKRIQYIECDGAARPQWMQLRLWEGGARDAPIYPKQITIFVRSSVANTNNSIKSVLGYRASNVYDTNVALRYTGTTLSTYQYRDIYGRVITDISQSGIIKDKIYDITFGLYREYNRDNAPQPTIYIGTEYPLAPYDDPGINRFAGRIYRFKVWDANNNLTMDLIPVVRNSDSNPGLWDLVKKTFQPSSGRKFGAGPEV